MPSDITPTHINAQEQVHAIRSNDERELKQFYQQNYAKVERYVLNNSGTADEAKDIYQEAFIAVWRNIQRDRFELQQAGSLDGYLYRIAKNKWIDHLRNKKTKRTITVDEDKLNDIAIEPLPEESADYIDAVKKEYLFLGQKCRDLLNMFYYQKQSLKEIASFFNWTEPSAKNNKYRCLEELRTMVKKKIQK